MYFQGMSVIVCIAILVCTCCSGVATAQKTAPVTGIDVNDDVIDHSRFDSLWRASKKHGKLDTRAVATEVYASYRRALAEARPNMFYPQARIAFWVNAYLAVLMDVMSYRAGYRATLWDSLFLTRDTVTVAGGRFTLHQLADTVEKIAGSVAIRAFFCTGSSTGPPYPSRALYAKTVKSALREQLRRLIRSEKFVLYDPAGRILQLARMFESWIPKMKAEQGSPIQFLLPWMTEETAAQVALAGSQIRIQISDRIETFKRQH
ncbi:MAG: hypothetical protein OKBPIBMD_01738 [Chlorobi bacterium]|nr:MAG: hypothetical protein UZ06_CHB003001823 [Chlorobi bacterium OLB6]MBV6464284.1 hypothetical protein [Chlorobiota bacterium]